jgi:hypothetical protein
MPSPNGPNLCRACGFCCDGTFFSYGGLADEEVDRVRKRRLVMAEKDERPAFRQPCTAHDGDACTIYDDRPQCCRAYRCRLLERVEQGEVSWAHAVDRIARVRELAAKIRAAAPPERAGDPLIVVARDLVDDAATAPWRHAHAELLMDVGELVTICMRQFGVRDDGKMSAP